MANTFNKVTAIVRLGQDPEVRYTPNGVAVANISGASDHSYKKDNEWIKETEWTRMTAFGKMAERIGEQAMKGTLMYIEGRLKTSKWDDKEGMTRYSTDVILFSVNFLDGYNKPDYDRDDKSEGRPPTPPAHDDDDIPF